MNHKADQIKFDHFIEETNSYLNDIKEYTEINRNMVHGCENYLEKYLPLFNQRQINETLDFVIPSVKTKWRVKKYGDAKNEQYTRRILQDDGKPDLPGVMDRTKNEMQASNPLSEAAQELKATSARIDETNDVRDSTRVLDS